MESEQSDEDNTSLDAACLDLVFLFLNGDPDDNPDSEDDEARILILCWALLRFVDLDGNGLRDLPFERRRTGDLVVIGERELGDL